MGDLILKPSSGSGNKVRIQDQTGADNLIIDADASMTGVKPHIIPDVLYPAVAGKLLDGSTSHSGAYGTAQSDGRSYYFTEIKGSSFIADPRIGAYYGATRHRTSSVQLREQETATHGKDVYSVDGRDWIRVVGDNGSAFNNTGGNGASCWDTDNFWEITFYGNQLLIQQDSHNANRGWTVTVDGGSASAERSPTQGSLDGGILGGRYWNSGSMGNTQMDETLGIHTVKLTPNGASDECTFHSIETIVQDVQDFTATNATNILTTTGHTLTNGDQIRLTGSDLPNGLNATTTYYVISVSGNNFQVSTSSGGSAVTFSDDGSGTRRWTALNNIQIPAQTVVSYGKKFSIDAQSTHYDPFHGFTNDTTLFSSRVDVATSLGLGTASTWGAPWDKGSSNHIRPYNGGRVVKWVDSSGNIKTSVTMMPANAQNIKTTASNEITTASATNSNNINFSDDAVDHSLSEVAKTFHWREFGNGSANGYTGATNADWTMIENDDATEDDVGWTMDDGLTALSGTGNHTTGDPDNITSGGDTKGFWFTFIGTGITLKTSSAGAGTRTMAINLPYGSHIYRHMRDGGATPDGTIDGVALADIAGDTYSAWEEVTFHQPKMPPVPVEDGAVIIADYMLMADFVGTAAGDVRDVISKGTRFVSCIRDFFYDENSNDSFSISVPGSGGTSNRVGYFVGQSGGSISSGSVDFTLPYFGTTVDALFYADRFGTYTEPINSTSLSVSSISTTTWSGRQRVTGQTIGLNAIKCSKTSDQQTFLGAEIATPIHTSHHYQDIRGNTGFETPFLRELVGGDRNMEQNNLIVTPDGKSWDEVTRDTSYLGKSRLFVQADISDMAGSTIPIPFDMFRGVYTIDAIQKDFAIAPDKFICLVDGMYNIETHGMEKSVGGGAGQILLINGTQKQWASGGGANDIQTFGINTFETLLKRGDWVQIKGWNLEGNNAYYSPRLKITRV